MRTLEKTNYVQLIPEGDLVQVLNWGPSGQIGKTRIVPPLRIIWRGGKKTQFRDGFEGERSLRFNMKEGTSGDSAGGSRGGKPSTSEAKGKLQG